MSGSMSEEQADLWPPDKAELLQGKQTYGHMKSGLPVGQPDCQPDYRPAIQPEPGGQQCSQSRIEVIHEAGIN